MEAIISEKNDRVLGSSGSSNTAGRRREGEGEEVTQCNLRLLYDSQSVRDGWLPSQKVTHEN